MSIKDELKSLGHRFHNDKALWMPSGSVRAVLSLIVIFSAVYMLINQIDIPEWFAVIVGIILRDYFSAGDKRDTTELINGKGENQNL
jgi:hypothetical protein